MTTYIVNTGDRSVTSFDNTVIVDFDDDDFDEDAILDYASDHGVPVGPKVDADKIADAVLDIVDVDEENYIVADANVLRAAIISQINQVYTSDEYAPRQWDGSADAVIESDTNPWIQDAEGNVFDFGGEGMRELHASGVLVGGTYIQRDDLAGWQDSFTDLHAALVAAKMVEHITGRPHFVWFHGA